MSNRLTGEKCLNDNSQNRDTSHDEAVAALADRLLTVDDTVFADIGGTIHDYGMSDVLTDYNTKTLEMRLSELALGVSSPSRIHNKNLRLLVIGLNISARNVAERIFDNVQDYLENNNE